jgi:2-polyprenyl-6-methoxyphenol hydroxylase-like FAD-dependent oxidoreductase
MSGYAGLIPMVVVGGLVIGLRFWLPSRRARPGQGRPGGRRRLFAFVPVLIPILMIGVAALAGAFSALDTPLGLSLAPLTLAGGVILGWFLGSRDSTATGATSRPTGDYTFWIFVGLITLRVVVRLMSVGSPDSPLATITADLMLLSVGMAITRLAMVWRRRHGHAPHAPGPSEVGRTIPAAGSPRPINESRERTGGLHVIVVGGGIGGLCLAQGLRGAGVSVAVYEKAERHPQASWQQGYQIHINAAGSAALADCLPADTYEQFTAKALRPREGVQLLTAQLEQINTLQPHAIAGSNPIVRTTLREVLLTGLDDVVRFNKAFVRYEQVAGGRIRAIFSDGSSAHGDVLVGADGTGSRVRAQYLPHATVEDIGLVGAAGKLPLTEETRSYLPNPLLTRLTGVRAPGGLYMVVTQSIHKPQGDAAAAATSSPSERTDEEADHLIWVFVSSRAAYGDDPGSLFHHGPKLQKLALQLIHDWHPALQRMVADTDPTVISATALRAAHDVEPWETTNVTLVGDAIHAMPPLQGQGGSTALRDAALLCRKLVEVERGETRLLSAINDYESAMLTYGFEAVHSARRMASMIRSGSPPTGGFLGHRFAPPGMQKRD